MLGDLNAFKFNDGYVDTIRTVRGTPTPPDHVEESMNALRLSANP